MPDLYMRCIVRTRNAACSDSDFSCILFLTGMPKGGRLPLDFFCNRRIPPVFGGMDVSGVGGSVVNYFSRREGFGKMSSAATGVHHRSFNTSSP